MENKIIKLFSILYFRKHGNTISWEFRGCYTHAEIQKRLHRMKNKPYETTKITFNRMLRIKTKTISLAVFLRIEHVYNRVQAQDIKHLELNMFIIDTSSRY